MVDVGVVADLSTAVGTLVLAAVTVASVRSANRSARVAEQSMLAGLRPLLLPSRLQDLEQKVGFIDRHFVHLPGGHATAEIGDEAVYLTVSLRNVGTGLALLHGWQVLHSDASSEPPTRPDDFRRLTRDLYVAGGDIGFWQGAVRDEGDPLWGLLRQRIQAREAIYLDLMYGDQEGRQRTISRISLLPVGDDAWLPAVSRHWYPDRPDPR